LSGREAEPTPVPFTPLLGRDLTRTHDGEWAGIPPSGNHINVPVVGIFEFDGGRLLCEKVYLDMATVLTQMGALPAVS
jgi:predicted ester cyclase